MEETNTIKGKEVIAYKGMNSDMTCRDFKYELGKTYKTDKAELCEWGFHACLNPIDALDYYLEEECSSYYKVKLSGEITKCDYFDTNVAATEMTIIKEINIDEVIKTTEWWKNENILDLLYWSDGFARVQRTNDEWNFITAKGKLLSKQWFIDAYSLVDGFAIVEREDYLYNFIDKQGKILSNEWFKFVDYFNKDGLARVQRKDSKWNFIDTKGNILIDEWFMWADYFHDGFARVERRNGEWNFITAKGNILLDEWYKWADNFKAGFAEVQRTNGEWAKIDKTGKLIKILQ